MPRTRQVPAPKHNLLHRLKRLWRFTDNEWVEALAVQTALISHTVGRLGALRGLGLAVDWTMFETVLRRLHEDAGNVLGYEVKGKLTEKELYCQRTDKRPATVRLVPRGD